jgi:hypothetical protein
MTSVLEMKEQLVTEQAKAVALADKSLQAIETITGTANFYLTILAIFIALIGLIGLVAVYVASKREARRVAESRIKTYISSAEGAELVRSAIADEVVAQIERRSFVVVQPPKPEVGDPAFPTDPKAARGGGQ